MNPSEPWPCHNIRPRSPPVEPGTCPWRGKLERRRDEDSGGHWTKNQWVLPSAPWGTRAEEGHARRGTTGHGTIGKEAMAATGLRWHKMVPLAYKLSGLFCSLFTYQVIVLMYGVSLAELFANRYFTALWYM